VLPESAPYYVVSAASRADVTRTVIDGKTAYSPDQVSVVSTTRNWSPSVRRAPNSGTDSKLTVPTVGQRCTFLLPTIGQETNYS